MIWESGTLFNKAVHYISKAEDLDQDDPLRPLFYAFSIELLCKASLSYIHPTLIADPQDEGQSLMYSLGLPHRGQPKSLPAHSIYKRVHQLIDKFNDSHLSFCEYFSKLRNEEVHSGDSPMSTMNEKEWLPKFYTVSNILCESMKKELEELVGTEIVEHAKELIQTADKNEIDSIRKKIGNHKSVFEAKSSDDQAELKKIAKQFAISAATYNSDTVKCPSCDSIALVKGVEVKQSEPKYDGESFYSTAIYQTNHLICKACGLELKNQKEINNAGIDIRFTQNIGLDLHDFYHTEEYPEYDNM